MPRDWWSELRDKEPPFAPREKLLLVIMAAECVFFFLLGSGALRGPL